MAKKNTKDKEKERQEEREKKNCEGGKGYSLPNKKADLLANKIIGQHVKSFREKKLKEEANLLKTKEVLQKPSLLHRIIVLAWEKEKEESIWSFIRIPGKKKGQEINIQCYGNRESFFPNKVSVSLMYIPGFDGYVFRELVEFSDKEKEKIEKWLRLNVSDQ